MNESSVYTEGYLLSQGTKKMDVEAIIRKIAQAAGEELEYHSLKLGAVSVVCQLKNGGTLCWSDVDEHTCAVTITSKVNGKIKTRSAELRYSSLEQGHEIVFM